MKNIRIIVVLVAFSLVLFFWTLSKDSITEIDLNANNGQLKINEITIFARNLQKSQELKEIFSNIKISCVPLTENIDLSDFYIVVNTTPLGMQETNEGFSPLSEYSVSTLWGMVTLNPLKPSVFKDSTLSASFSGIVSSRI